jgi:hypothetical protein
MIGEHSNDDFPIELLAAYVDGELDAMGRARVERWLSEHPDALADLLDQESLSRGNVDYWLAVSPVQPRAETWRGVLARVESAIPHPVSRYAGKPGRRQLRRLGLVLALGGLAAALMIAFLPIERAQPNSVHEPVPPAVASTAADGEDYVFRVAGADDVQLIQFPEEAADLLVVGKHPLADLPLVFASATDVQVLNYGFDDQGEVPDHRAMTGPDTPMFVAPPRKR